MQHDTQSYCNFLEFAHHLAKMTIKHVSSIPHQSFLSTQGMFDVHPSWSLPMEFKHQWPDRWKTFSFSCKMFCRTGRTRVFCIFLFDDFSPWRVGNSGEVSHVLCFWRSGHYKTLVEIWFCKSISDCPWYILRGIQNLSKYFTYILALYWRFVQFLIHHVFGHENPTVNCWGFSRGGCCELWSNLERLGQILDMVVVVVVFWWWWCSGGGGGTVPVSWSERMFFVHKDPLSLMMMRVAWKERCRS